jgi:hypothetical protein
LAGKKKEKGVKPYVIRFRYSVEEESSFYIGATDAESAREAAEEMLAQEVTSRASNPEIVSVSEYQRQTPSTDGMSFQ